MAGEEVSLNSNRNKPIPCFWGSWNSPPQLFINGLRLFSLQTKRHITKDSFSKAKIYRVSNALVTHCLALWERFFIFQEDKGSQMTPHWGQGGKMGFWSNTHILRQLTQRNQGLQSEVPWQNFGCPQEQAEMHFLQKDPFCPGWVVQGCAYLGYLTSLRSHPWSFPGCGHWLSAPAGISTNFVFLERVAKSIWKTRIPSICSNPSKHHPLHRKWRLWNPNFSWCFGVFLSKRPRTVIHIQENHH